MIKILFICHGNICRSPMAEFVMKDLVKKAGLSDEFIIDSAAVSREEIGNGVHYGTREKLKEMGIPCGLHRAIQVTRQDYDIYDYLIAMDQYNIHGLHRLLGDDNKHKISTLLSFADSERDIADPWYTGNFDDTYDDVLKGCQALLHRLYPEVKNG